MKLGEFVSFVSSGGFGCFWVLLGGCVCVCVRTRVCLFVCLFVCLRRYAVLCGMCVSGISLVVAAVVGGGWFFIPPSPPAAPRNKGMNGEIDGTGHGGTGGWGRGKVQEVMWCKR